MAVQKLDLALGSEGLAAFAPGERLALGFFSGRIDPFAENTAAIRELFDRLEERLGGADGADASHLHGTIVRLAILPPLCEVRLLDLPGLRDEEIERVLKRDSTRHFLGGGRNLTVGGIRLAAGGRSLTAPVLAAAVPSPLLDAVHAAADGRGWEIDRIIPAHAAWWDALENARPAGRRSSGSSPQLLIASLGDTLHAIRIEEDSSAQLRRFPGSDTTALEEVAGGAPGSALILAPKEERARLSELLRADGWSEVHRDAPGDAREVAARGAAEALPEIVPAFIARKRIHRERGFTSRALAAAAVLLVIAAGIYYWGASRAYASVRAERAQLRPVVAPALAARDSLDFVTTRLEDLTALEGGTSGWTAFMVELAVLLPPETHLVSLRAVGDTVVIEGAGGRAGEALEALRTTPLLRDVQLEGPIQRDLEGGTTARERFTVSGIRVNDPTAASPSSLESESTLPSDGR